jgi:hypothetical protein
MSVQGNATGSLERRTTNGEYHWEKDGPLAELVRYAIARSHHAYRITVGRTVYERADIFALHERSDFPH